MEVKDKGLQYNNANPIYITEQCKYYAEKLNEIYKDWDSNTTEIPQITIKEKDLNVLYKVFIQATFILIEAHIEVAVNVSHRINYIFYNK